MNRFQCQVSAISPIQARILSELGANCAEWSRRICACFGLRSLRLLALLAPSSSPPSNPSPGNKFPFPAPRLPSAAAQAHRAQERHRRSSSQEDHELPFVSGSVLIPGGSRDEDPAKAGLVGLYGQAWRTSGTAKMDGDAMDDLLEAKAAHIETAGDDDSTARLRGTR